MNKLGVWIIVIVLLASFVSSAPPFLSSTGEDLGLVLQIPAHEYFKVGKGGEVYVHVFNTSYDNGELLTAADGVNCSTNIYGTNGSLIFESYATPVGDSFWFYIDDSIISESGIYAWIIYCNISNYGGWEIDYFEANHAGSDGSHLQAIFIFLSVLAISFIAIGLIILFKKGDKDV